MTAFYTQDNPDKDVLFLVKGVLNGMEEYQWSACYHSDVEYSIVEEYQWSACYHSDVEYSIVEEYQWSACYHSDVEYRACLHNNTNSVFQCALDTIIFE